MSAAFFLRKDVNLTFDVGVGFDRADFGKDLSSFDIFTIYATEKSADVVARLSEVKELTEHLNAGNGGFAGGFDTDDLNFVADFNFTSLNSARSNGAAAGDGEYVFDRHKEGLVVGALGGGDVGVYCVEELADAIAISSPGNSY